MAVSFRTDPAFSSSVSDPQTLNPSSDPSSGDILIIAAGASRTGGSPGQSVTASDSFGGTWTTEHDQIWGSRRRMNVIVNDDWTTATGSVDVNFQNVNQDSATGLLIVEGAASYTEDATAGDSSGSNWTPTLTASQDGHVVVIQMESEATISTPSGWTKEAQVTASGGLRSLAVFSHVGSLSDTTPTFSWSGTEGYTGWSCYHVAAAGSDTIDVGVLALAHTLPSPQVDGALTAGVLALSHTLPSPQVDGALEAGVLTLGHSFPSPQIDGDLTPNVLALTHTLPPPTLSGAGTIDADVLALTHTLPSPSVSGDLTPDVLALTHVMPSPTLSGDLTADVLALTHVMPSPSVSGDLTPDVLALTHVMPSPTLSGADTITADLLALTHTLPSPLLSGDLTADLLALTHVLPPPTLSGADTIVADLLALTHVFPSPSVLSSSITADLLALTHGLLSPSVHGALEAGVLSPTLAFLSPTVNGAVAVNVLGLTHVFPSPALAASLFKLGVLTLAFAFADISVFDPSTVATDAIILAVYREHGFTDTYREHGYTGTYREHGYTDTYEAGKHGQ